MFDIIAHPDIVKHWGRKDRPWPEKDLRYYYDLAMEGIAESNVAIEVSTAGLRKPVGELYPSSAFLEMCLDAGNPVALSSDAHVPEQLGFGYDQALEFLKEHRRDRAGRLRPPRAHAWSRSRHEHAHRHRLGLPSARRRPPVDPRRRDDRATTSASTVTPTPTS